MLANDGADVYSADIDSIYLMRRGKLLETEETVESACRYDEKGCGEDAGFVPNAEKDGDGGGRDGETTGRRRKEKGRVLSECSLLCYDCFDVY
jgi:hypothetical protein